MSRRRRAAQDEIIAPGYGTKEDLNNLSHELGLPFEAVFRMMSSKGRGRRSAPDAPTQESTPISNAWADFMQEEGVVTEAKRSLEASQGTTTATSTSNASGSSSRTYLLANKKTKKKTTKKAKTNQPPAGVLVQAGTLDVRVVGRSKEAVDLKYQLNVPTILLKTPIVSVFCSGHACHSIALAQNGTVYGWGRNEQKQLTSDLPDNVFYPTEMEMLPQDIQGAALGKSHTLFLFVDGTVQAVGSNKDGQCGVNVSTVSIPNLRQCVFEGNNSNADIVQVACGEAFSVALDADGCIYTTGTSQYGCLGNGDTGEKIVTAGRSSFDNEKKFVKRTTFCHAPNEKLHGSSDKAKVVPLSGEHVRIQQVACGKSHTLLLEAECEEGLSPRVFSFGCGDFGVLGHGIQADELYPRLIGSLSHLKLPSTGDSRTVISAGQHCSLFQTVNGHVYYFGKHRSVGEATMRPTLIDALSNNSHVVTLAKAGGSTVFCSTSNALTVSWGQGLYGELGFGTKKSSSKPDFVQNLRGCRIVDLGCGYGHTVFVVQNDDKEDKEAVAKLPVADDN